MIKFMRRAAAAMSAAFVMASPATAQESASEENVSIGMNYVGCLSDRHGGVLHLRFHMKLKDLAKPGTTPDGKEFEHLLKQDKSALNEKYKNIDPAMLYSYAAAELDGVLSEFDSERFGNGGRKINDAVKNAFESASQNIRMHMDVPVRITSRIALITPVPVIDCP